MPVVDFEKPFALQLDHVGGLECPAEVGVINVGEHGLACFLALLQHGVHVVLQHGGRAGASTWGDVFFEVRRVEVDGQSLKPVGDLLRLHQQETARHTHLRLILGESLEPDLWRLVLDFVFHPVVAKPFEVLFKRQAAARVFLDMDPPLSLGENVVVGDAEKIVVVAAVPVGDHLGIVIPVAPERMRVKVALPPTRLRGVCIQGDKCQGQTKLSNGFHCA